MKKYTLVWMALAFVLTYFTFPNSTNAFNCAPGENFSTSTGLPCNTIPRNNDCAPGDLFSSINGRSCAQGINLPQTPIVTAILPVGCNSNQGFSQSTGSPCISIYSANIGNTVNVYGSGFTPNAYIQIDGGGYSPVDGQSHLRMPANFISSNVVSFKVPVNVGVGHHVVQVETFMVSNSADIAFTSSTPTFPPGCNSTFGFSTLTGQSCGRINNSSSITILSPNGGESYAPGSLVPVKWKTDNSLFKGAVNISFDSISQGATAGGFAYGVGNTGASSIQIPPTTRGATDYKATITYQSENGTTYTDQSDNFFTISSSPTVSPVAWTNPTINIVSPNGGETYTKGSTMTVNFTAHLPAGVGYDVWLQDANGSGPLLGSGVTTGFAMQSINLNIPLSVMGNAATATNYYINVKVNSCSVSYDGFFNTCAKDDRSDGSFTLLGNGTSGGERDGRYDGLAQSLTDQGAVLYGAFWCPHCQTQKQLFGSSASLLPYVECSTPDANSQMQICKDRGITAYPTWEFADGSRLMGEISLQKLADKISYPLFGK